MMLKSTNMRKILFVAATFAVLSACKQSAEKAGEAGEVKAASAEAVSYTIDKSASTVKWEGAKMTETVHTGNVAISEGSLSAKQGKLEAGSFTIDMNSITDSDLTDTAYANKLVGHLKSADFFQTDSFPTAKFEITAVEAASTPDSARINGNLTLKGITKGISFPAKVSLSDSTVDASARITINRNDWGVIWGGGQSDKKIKDMLKNNLIKDDISFDVALKGRK
jgi:polyisoprenoid-binding protein YceI